MWSYNSLTKFSTSKIRTKDSPRQTTFYPKVTMELKLCWSWGFVFKYWKAAFPRILESKEYERWQEHRHGNWKRKSMENITKIWFLGKKASKYEKVGKYDKWDPFMGTRNWPFASLPTLS